MHIQIQLLIHSGDVGRAGPLLFAAVDHVESFLDASYSNSLAAFQLLFSLYLTCRLLYPSIPAYTVLSYLEKGRRLMERKRPFLQNASRESSALLSINLLVLLDEMHRLYEKTGDHMELGSLDREMRAVVGTLFAENAHSSTVLLVCGVFASDSEQRIRYLVLASEIEESPLCLSLLALEYLRLFEVSSDCKYALLARQLASKAQSSDPTSVIPWLAVAQINLCNAKNCVGMDQQQSACTLAFRDSVKHACLLLMSDSSYAFESFGSGVSLLRSYFVRSALPRLVAELAQIGFSLGKDGIPIPELLWIVEVALRFDPENCDLLLYSATLKRMVGRYHAAAKVYQALFSMPSFPSFPKNLVSVLACSDTWTVLGRSDISLSLLENNRETMMQQDPISFLHCLAHSAVAANDLILGATCLTQVVQATEGKAAEPWCDLVRVYLKFNAADEAYTTCKSLLESHPNNVSVKILWCDALLHRQDFNACIQFAESAGLVKQKARALKQAGRTQELVQVLTEMLGPRQSLSFADQIDIVQLMSEVCEDALVIGRSSLSSEDALSLHFQFEELAFSVTPSSQKDIIKRCNRDSLQLASFYSHLASLYYGIYRSAMTESSADVRERAADMSSVALSFASHALMYDPVLAGRRDKMIDIIKKCSS
eukprot:ANDGO_07815.mRNA.1 hypothetical protein